MTEKATRTPPYGPYLTLKNTVKDFADNTPPTRLDRNVLSNLSGGAYSALVITLRFLGLVGEGEVVQESFRALVRARRESEQKYREHLLQVLEVSFKEIVESIDIERGTLKELEDAFRAAGVSQGEMLERSVRFYVRALQDCGVKVSPHITKRRKRSPRTVKKKATSKKPKEGEKKDDDELLGDGGGGDRTDGPPEGYERLPLLGGLGFVEFKSPATEQTCKIIEGAANYLRLTLSAGKEG